MIFRNGKNNKKRILINVTRSQLFSFLLESKELELNLFFYNFLTRLRKNALLPNTVKSRISSSASKFTATSLNLLPLEKTKKQTQ